VDVVVQVPQKLVILINFSYIIDMKPLNLDNSPCSPISSNCVIWQGPAIPCIKLCQGDTVSDVVFQLATELCTIIDQLNVSNYDLSCFASSACPPADFQALIQYLINQICTSQGITVDTTRTTSTCPDCVVTVAPCFIQGTTTTMQLVDYVTMIGNRVCSLVSELAALQSQINSLDIRVSVLENTPPPSFTLPSISVSCLLTPGSYTIDVVLDALMNNTNGYCSLLNATGLPADISTAVLSQCIDDTDIALASLVGGGPGQTFQAYYASSWVINSNLNTAADAINNIWIAICDTYAYANSLGLSVQDTATIDLTYTGNVLSAKVSDTGWVDLDGFNYYSGVTKPKCRRIGNVVHFKGTVFVPLENPSSPGNVVPLASATTYNSVAGNKTWSGTGGCTIDSNGAILFNNGASIVPSTVTTGNFDDTYSLGWVVAVRGIDVNATYGTALTSMLAISITAGKNLQAQLIHDIEITPTRGSGYQGNSPLRLITSNVRVGEYLPNYLGTGTDIHNAPSNANFPVVSDTFNATWPFSCDAGNENQIGGFNFKLDGLIAYIQPCNIETGLSVVC
jgi:hypothetical protein